MNTPKPGPQARTIVRPPAKADPPPAGHASPKRPLLKPTGPVIYSIEKGANVWPGRK